MNRIFLKPVVAAMLVLSAGAAQAQTPRQVQVQLDPLKMLTQGGSYLGVNVQEVDSESAQKLKLNDVYGVEVVSVEDGSPAAKAGLQKGDIVLEYQGQRVEGTQQFVRFVRETPAGRSVKMTVHRDNKPQTLTATVGTRKPAVETLGNTLRNAPQMIIPDFPNALMTVRSSALGIEAQPVEGQLADFFGVKKGVLVRSVTKDSSAEKGGLKAGDVITKIGGTEVATTRELSAALRAPQTKEEVAVTITRDRKETSVTVKLEQGGSRSTTNRPRVTNRWEMDEEIF